MLCCIILNGTLDKSLLFSEQRECVIVRGWVSTREEVLNIGALYITGAQTII